MIYAFIYALWCVFCFFLGYQMATNKIKKAMEAADKAYFESCEKIRQHTIEKACTWLKYNLRDYAGEDSCRNQVPFDESIFEDFYKSMEE